MYCCKLYIHDTVFRPSATVAGTAFGVMYFSVCRRRRRRGGPAAHMGGGGQPQGGIMLSRDHVIGALGLYAD